MLMYRKRWSGRPTHRLQRRDIREVQVLEWICSFKEWNAVCSSHIPWRLYSDSVTESKPEPWSESWIKPESKPRTNARVKSRSKSWPRPKWCMSRVHCLNLCHNHWIFSRNHCLDNLHPEIIETKIRKLWSLKFKRNLLSFLNLLSLQRSSVYLDNISAYLDCIWWEENQE